MNNWPLLWQRRSVLEGSSPLPSWLGHSHRGGFLSRSSSPSSLPLFRPIGLREKTRWMASAESQQKLSLTSLRFLSSSSRLFVQILSQWHLWQICFSWLCWLRSTISFGSVKVGLNVFAGNRGMLIPLILSRASLTVIFLRYELEKRLRSVYS